jgi:hypothetical protein
MLCGRGGAIMATRKQTTKTAVTAVAERGAGALMGASVAEPTVRATVRPAPSALPSLASAVAQCPPRYLPVVPAQPVQSLLPLGPAPSAAAPIRHAARPTGVRRRFGELRTALGEGWEIVQPIFARPLWSAADDSITAFNFVLRRGAATRLLTVPEGRTVARFVRDQRLLVDYRR